MMLLSRNPRLNSAAEGVNGMAVTISLCMIVKNEEEVLDRCLASAAPVADEIIIVDTGSQDATADIARRYTDKVFSFPWQDDFAAARNFSFSKASMQYCLWLDADDVILPADRTRFLRLKEDLDPSVDVIMLPYHIAFHPDNTPSFWYYRERIVKNSPDYRWQGRVHEAIVPIGNVIYGSAAVSHFKLRPSDPDRNLRILEKMMNDPGDISPRTRFYYGRELYEHGRYPEAVGALEAFWRDSGGWIENKIDACRILSYCYHMMGQREMAFRVLFRSFMLDTPRAEICCELGRLFMEDNQFRLAAYWYETALGCPYQADRGGFIRTECYGYLPSIQLCVCYDRLGDTKRAEAYNELAGKYQPDSQAYQANKVYFDRLRHDGDSAKKE
ncbi:tetratricopeptide repeat-containing glycosyltransferase family 2 protein [Ructibacterium gallinarum]